MTWFDRAAVPLGDDRVLVRPITPEDRDGLHAVAMDPAVWQWFVVMVATDEDFDAYFDGNLDDHAARRRVVFVVVDAATGRVAGTTSYGNLSEPDGRLEIGWTWLGDGYRGTGLNRRVKYLLLEHAFERLGAERVEFKTDRLNAPARKALSAIGAVEEGTLRSFNPMPGGRRRDAVYYSVIRSEWPGLKPRLAAPATGRETSRETGRDTGRAPETVP